MSDVAALRVEDLQEIVEQVWSSYLDPEGIEPLIPVYDDIDAMKTDMHASVSITGTWHGHVVVACNEPAAKNCSAAFLAMEVEEVGEADMMDVLGELANIVGGNVKSMLPPGCFVSLPTVVTGEAPHYPSAEPVCQLAGHWMGDPFVITMWQSRGDGGDAA
ncbi:chemotaxis protein CheX [Catenuloplanes atrovinosus]|uniref:Chemotaxis protein CheX n=1 Tax=Catenuloplanes atrovinosus TaxID=137266 RepID=A0AAE3YXJ9_9ACTN|nr:chemotaxis protein CheX [Catenuloplanes atrovinosus]MDR7280456.1 chemotaxis protein CheX [Catenuloplanes atrovinosus]